MTQVGRWDPQQIDLRQSPQPDWVSDRFPKGGQLLEDKVSDRGTAYAKAKLR